jgi:hypothetical protein
MLNYRRVYGGFAEDEQRSLCERCIHSLVMKGRADSDMLTFCDRLFRPIRVPFAVTECSCFSDKRLPDLTDLEEIAVPLVSQSHSKPTTGFGGSAKTNGNGKTENSS